MMPLINGEQKEMLLAVKNIGIGEGE